MLFILGLGLSTRAFLGYSTSVSEADYTQARFLAMAGLEDFRTKASLDLRFPPRLADGDVPITYGEELRDKMGRKLGRFQVTIVSDKSVEPHYIYQVKSIGTTSKAQVLITGYLEAKPGMRWLGFEQEESDWY